MAIARDKFAETFGIFGNIISFMVFLSPIPTFIKIYKRKSTEDFQSLPYLSALFSAMLWIYYALQKKDSSFLLITINSAGVFIQTIYILIFLFYANNHARKRTISALGGLNVFLFGAIVLICQLFIKKSPIREKVVGVICVVFSVGVFAAPLRTVKLVIKTKSVEFMPIFLTLFLTISAVMWLIYGVAIKDIFVTIPNILGLVMGAIQIIVYVIVKYRNAPVVDQTSNSNPNTTSDNNSVPVLELSPTNQP